MGFIEKHLRTVISRLPSGVALAEAGVVAIICLTKVTISGTAPSGSRLAAMAAIFFTFRGSSCRARGLRWLRRSSQERLRVRWQVVEQSDEIGGHDFVIDRAGAVAGASLVAAVHGDYLVVGAEEPPAR